ncbi:MAG: S41 family peptidase, partial [Silanimonas sp.]
AVDAEAKRLGSDADGAMHSPMWLGGRWYFVGNRDGIDALWSMDAEGGDRRRHVQHDGWDVRAARSDGTRIVYQRGADVRVFDPSNNDDRDVPLALLSDFEQRRERWLERPLRFFEDARLSPKGDRVAVTVRGRVAVAGPGPTRRVEVASPPEHRARGAVPSHDGKWVYAISDADGRPEIWRYAADGRSEATQLTRGGTHHRWRLYPSPDGRHLAHTDKSGALHLLDLGSGRSTTIDRSGGTSDNPYGRIEWSPDGKGLAFSRPATRHDRDQIHVFRVGDTAPVVVTSPRYVSTSPSFSPDGRWLYFVSERAFSASPSSPWGDRNTGPGFDRRGKVYALALQPGNRFPFAPTNELIAAEDAGAEKNDEGKDGDAKDNADGDGATKALPPIVLDGLADRLFETPVPPGNYTELFVAAERLYLLAYERDEGTLMTLPIGNEGGEPTVFAKNIESAEISPDRKRVAYVQRSGEDDPVIAIVDAGEKLPDDLSSSLVRLADWRLPIDPVREWRQMFADAWRLHRDFSFDPTMRGLDWDAVRAQHEPLLARVTDRAELDDLLAQMVAPLAILHSQVGGADLPEDVESASPSMLGAEFAPTADGLRIARIYRGDRELPAERAPLAQPGVDAREGDILASINGRAVRNTGDLAAALHHQAGQQVLLTLQRGGREGRTVVVPVDPRRNATLRYGDWVQGRVAAVERAGEGRIGYLHLRAM